MKSELVLIAIVFLFSSTCFGQDEPVLINPLFGYSTNRDIAFVDELHGYMITYSSSYKTIDGGETWTEIPSITQGKKLELSDQIYAIMSDETLTISTDGGVVWNEVFTPQGFIDIIDVSITSDEIIYLATQTSLFKSSDIGQTWTEMGIPLPLMSIHFFNADEGIVSTNDGRIRKTTDGGETWSTVSEGETINDAAGDFDFPVNEVGYAYSFNGKLYKTEDSGNSWFELNAPVLEYRSVTFYDQNIGILGAGSGSIIRTIDGGENWEVIELVEAQNYYYINNVAFRNEQECIAAGPGSNFYRSSDGGSSWSAGSCIFGEILALDIYNEDSLYILGEENFALLHTDVSYCNIISEVDILYNDGRDVEMITESLGYAIMRDTLKRTEDGGLNWENVFLSDIGNCSYGYDLAFANGKLYFSTGCVPRFRISEDLGYTWTASGNPLRGNIHVHNDQLIYVYPFGPGFATPGLNKSTDGGFSWDFISVPETPVRSAYFVNEQIGYAGLYRDLYKTEDGGENWTLIPEPDDGYFTQYTDMAFVNEDIGWVTDGSDFHETLDGGMTWNTYSAFGFIKEIEVFGSSLYAFGTNSAILRKQFSQVVSVPTQSDKQSRKLLFFPNPIEDQFSIKLPKGISAQKCSLISLEGRTIAHLNLDSECNECRVEVPENIAQGLYFIQLITVDGRVLSGRVVIR